MSIPSHNYEIIMIEEDTLSNQTLRDESCSNSTWEVSVFVHYSEVQENIPLLYGQKLKSVK